MPKNIVLCLDGTWNGPDAKAKDGSATPTNVQKLFESLKGSAALQATDNEKEILADADGSLPAQAAKYIHGVGDTNNPLAKAAEGATGAGLVARLVRGYTYLSRLYQPGDAIHILGFSRGAYTARALAGFVVRQGLLDWQGMQLQAGSEQSYSAGLAAWGQYKSSVNEGKSSMLHSLAMALTDLHDRFELGLHPAPALRFVSDVEVQSVAVWDTVGALGLPDLQEQDGTEVRKDVFEFADTALSGRVRQGFHAIAVDERRVDFTPTLWDARDGVIQVLFAGAHADVGGGYPVAESGLSNGPMVWMARQLASAGVRFESLPAGTPDALAVQHQPWAGAPYATASRHFGPGLKLSQRLLQRMMAPAVPVEGQAAAAYRPANLVNSYVMLDWSGPAPHVEVVA